MGVRALSAVVLLLTLGLVAACTPGSPTNAVVAAPAPATVPATVPATAPTTQPTTAGGGASWRAAMATPDPLLADLTDDTIFRLGEKMYRDGLLPSGEVMEAYIRGDIEVDSTAFSCASCHQRAGLGSVEGGVVTPPTTGRLLYQPYRRPPSLNDVADFKGRIVYAKTIIERPAYNRDALKRSLRDGVDPVGEAFNDVMPRYPLSDRDMAIMVRYLELLSSDYSPGAELGRFSFATVITDDVGAADREALLTPLRQFVAGQNQQIALYRDFLKFGYQPTGDMKYSFNTVTLAVWELKGPPATWDAQLAAYYAKDQPFALLGGISNQPWQPIHDFCEARRLPCFYPITDLPAVSPHTWYNVYFNKGYYQEGEAVARFLKRRDGVDADSRILQLVEESPAGRALAAGFAGGRSDLGLAAVETIAVSAEALRQPQTLAALVAAKKPGIVLLWADARALPALPVLIARLAPPAALFVSSTALGAATTTIPEALRAQVFITYPYRLTPFVGDPAAAGFLARLPTTTSFRNFGARRIATRTATMLNQTVLQGMRVLYDNLYRDYLLDVLSMQMDQVVPDYERISFGPGQRYASKGCYILQLGPGVEPELLPRSEWVVH